MPALFQNLLIWHVLLGISGIIFFGVVLVGLFKNKPNIKLLKWTSGLGFLSFLGSWFVGGYYYINYYGSAVKPGIKAGDYRWAHSVIMETKEHVFLFLPFLGVVIFLVICLLSRELNENSRLKNSLSILALLVVLLGLFITFSGMAISGAAR